MLGAPKTELNPVLTELVVKVPGSWSQCVKKQSTSNQMPRFIQIFRLYPFSRTWLGLGMVLAGFILSGCSTETDAIFRSLQYAYDRSAGAESAALNPNFRYLRATVDGRVVLLALGYVDSDAGGPVEVWYSADRGVIRLQNGRVVGAVGLTPEWREVALRGAPGWPELMSGDHSVEWVRVRDVMPGYHSGIIDNLVSRRVARVRGTALVGVDPNDLNWFEDIRVPDSPRALAILRPANFDNDLGLPPARYGVSVAGGNATVVYGEQCLSKTFCFTWQRWP